MKKENKIIISLIVFILLTLLGYQYIIIMKQDRAITQHIERLDKIEEVLNQHILDIDYLLDEQDFDNWYRFELNDRIEQLKIDFGLQFKNKEEL